MSSKLHPVEAFPLTGDEGPVDHSLQLPPGLGMLDRAGHDVIQLNTTQHNTSICHIQILFLTIIYNYIHKLYKPFLYNYYSIEKAFL